MLDVAVLATIVIVAALYADSAVVSLERALGLAPAATRLLFVALAALLCAPFVIGVARLSIRLGQTLADSAIPRGGRTVDLDAAPRRVLALTLELGIALVASAVLLAITQPFLPVYAGLALLAALVAGAAFALWRRATDLEGHVRAGSLAVAQALAKRARAPGPTAQAEPLKDIHAMLPGLGEPVVVTLGASHAATGQTLSELHLRGRCGAAVLAIVREGQSIIAPGGDERLLAGDALALTGTHEAIEAARALLLGPS
jgi:CPA2 family monovalent cation:H+ antiporter-2